VSRLRRLCDDEKTTVEMNLIVDIGNSRVKIAVMEDDDVLGLRAFSSLAEADLFGLLDEYPAVGRCIVSSTGIGAGSIAESLRGRGLKVLEMSPSTPVPIGNAYGTPETLGCDRLAAAVGAVALTGGGNCVIVDFGTAITIDLVTGGVFRGGSISPGVRMRFRALHDYTSRLPECSPTYSDAAFGRSTREAVEQGVMQGIRYEIEGHISRLTEKNGNLSVIFTGGDAKFFVKRIKNTIFANRELVICGLNRILEYNAKIE